MKTISIEKIIEHKILPYDIYSEFGEKLFAAGEALTPGKLLQLKHFEFLYVKDDAVTEVDENDKVVTSLESSLNISGSKDEEVEPKQSTALTETKTSSAPIVEEYDMNPTTIKHNKLSVDDIDISNYKGPINKLSKIDPQTQLKIKAFYQKTIEMLDDKKSPNEILGMLANIRDKIIQDIIFSPTDVKLSSQLKLLGEYNRCHALNTAILAGMVSKQMELSESQIYDIVLASLLHDIGKSKLPEDLRSRMNSSGEDKKVIEAHTNLGYRIIRAEMELPENIAKVALDHHEFNDGTGYPSGKSGDRINVETQIIAVCNYFDNLTSNRTQYQIKTTKEALRVMLQLGTKKFSAKALYTFVHMFSYNDTVNFEEMIL